MYHDIGKTFTSPTINLIICDKDFVEFCENLEYYMKSEPDCVNWLNSKE